MVWLPARDPPAVLVGLGAATDRLELALEEPHPRLQSLASVNQRDENGNPTVGYPENMVGK